MQTMLMPLLHRQRQEYGEIRGLGDSSVDKASVCKHKDLSSDSQKLHKPDEVGDIYV